MNLDGLTFGQRACVTMLHGPLAVSAGAGSGKTHTLTQRIAWALTPGSGLDGRPFLSSVNDVLAITFTEKAAQELKERVRGVLFAEGLKEQAMLVDEAWISTIHGMCARILRAHALEAGVSPYFQILDDLKAEALRKEAVEEVLASHADDLSGEFAALFSEYGAYAKGSFGQGSLLDMADMLVKEASAHPEGVACFVLPSQALPGDVILRDTMAVLEEFAPLVAEQKPSKARSQWLDAYGSFEEETRGLLGTRLDAAALLRWFAHMPVPDASFGTKDYKAEAKETKLVCGQMLREAKRLFCQPYLDALLCVTRLACEAYEEKKRAKGVLGHDDLLVKTAVLLRDYPEIAARYADKFKLVMVDEFQDTDGLQLDIIGKLAGPDCQRLCVVGDPQQSIYRFRGADPSVFRAHRESLRVRNPQGVIELADNFRSHGDILRFVDRVFGQTRAFPEYMPLRESRVKPSVPVVPSGRVRVLQTSYDSKSFGAERARQVEAARIADIFTEYRKAGYKASDLVLLLGRMTNADVYAQALRSRGFSCAVTGGSVFSRAPEVHAMACLAKVIANPRAEDALHQLLAGGMFRLSSSDLLCLATQGGACGRSGEEAGLEAGLRWAIAAKEESCLSVRVRCAAQVLSEACYGPRVKGLSELMADAVARSGWMARLGEEGPEGQAVAANILKCIRLAEAFQKETLGLASAARRFATHVQAAKEAPGVLSVQEGNFVRIMSVHASKGLEFPVVAVAEMQRNTHRASALSCERMQGAVRISLDPKSSVESCKGKGAFKLSEPKEAPRNFSGSEDYLKRHSLEQEFEERERLLYVALTRAQEAVVLCMRTLGVDKPCGSANGEEAFDMVRRGLFGQEDIPAGQTYLDFGGETPALVSRANAADLADMLPQGVPAPGSQDFWGRGAWGPAEPFALCHHAVTRESQGFVSYSTLRESLGLTLGSEASCAAEGDDLFWANLTDDLCRARADATDLGTAFHLLARRCIRREGEAWLVRMPEPDAIRAVASRCGLDGAARARLAKALELWVRSPVARKVEAWPFVRAELPFCVSVPGCSELFLEGAMDLFASDCEACGNGRQRAYIVDYKTGGLPEQSEEGLRRKHELQAQCYAYAALRQGFAEVGMDFVYVEQPDCHGEGGLLSVRFEFGKEDLDGLGKAIRHIYERAGERC